MKSQCARLLRYCAGVSEYTDDTQDLPGSMREDSFLPPGTPVGRYVILSTLGVGGMGIVYSAFDPELDRKVAIKVLRRATDSDDYRQQLLAEAKSMARVSHRNVAAIFDVGTVDERVFLAMEHIDGLTLKDWGTAKERAENEIISAMVAAGRGLSAAHRAGVIHRDFKPANVLMGSDGRVVVTDFGIAHAVADEDLASGERSTKVGTPAYMAPETLKGAASDSRSDQFSFGITLYELLYREHPFAGRSRQIPQAIVAGDRNDPPREARISAHVHSVTSRALSHNPSDRFSSMDELLSTLTGDDGSVRRRRWIGAGLGAAVFGAGIVALVLSGDDPCGGFGERVNRVWSEPVRERITKAFRDSAVPYASEAYELTERALDAYANSWVAAQSSSCRADTANSSETQEVRILRAFCLEGRMKRFRSTVALLEKADASVVEKAAEAVRALPTIRDCEDIEALSREVPPPDDPLVAGTVEELRVRLADAQSAFNLGAVESGIALAQQVVEDSKTIDALAVRAEAQLLYGQFLHTSGKSKEAVATLRDAIYSSVAADYDVLSFEGWNALADALGAGDRDIEGGKLAGRNAEAYWQRLGRDGFLGAKLYTQRGMTALSDVKLDESLEHLTQALKYLESSAYDDNPLEVRILGGLAAVNAKSGRLKEAVAFNRRAQTLSATLYGSLNPQTLNLQLNRGNLYYLSGDYGAALETHRELLKKYEGLYGPDHKDTARTVFNVAVVNLALGNNEDALVMLERAVRIRTSTLGPKHPSTLRGEQAVVHTLKELARYGEAVTRAEAVLAAQRETLGEEHYDIAYSLVTLAEILGLQGRTTDGIRVGSDAVAMIGRVMGEDHPFRGEALTTLGAIYGQAGRRDQALAHFESAIETLKDYDGDATLIAKARFSWAKAAWTDSAKRARALEEASRAEKIFTESKTGSDDELAQLRAWLDSRRPADAKPGSTQ